MSGRIIFKKVEIISGRIASHFPKTERVSLRETWDTLLCESLWPEPLIWRKIQRKDCIKIPYRSPL